MVSHAKLPSGLVIVLVLVVPLGVKLSNGLLGLLLEGLLVVLVTQRVLVYCRVEDLYITLVDGLSEFFRGEIIVGCRLVAGGCGLVSSSIHILPYCLLNMTQFFRHGVENVVVVILLKLVRLGSHGG